MFVSIMFIGSIVLSFLWQLYESRILMDVLRINKLKNKKDVESWNNEDDLKTFKIWL